MRTMKEDNKTDQEMEQGDVIEITPVDSPSENFLVEEQLRKMPSIFARGLIYIIILMILSALIYSLLAKIDIVVESRAVSIPQTHITSINSSLSGYISEIYISEGQFVENNAPLFVIKPAIIADSRETISYLSKAGELRNAIPLEEESYNTKISSAKDEMKTVDFDLNYLKKEAENLEAEFANTKKLYEKKLTSISEYNNIKSRLERARTDIDKLASQKTMLEKNIRNLELEKSSALHSMKNELEMNEKLLSLKGGSPDHELPGDEAGSVIRAINSGTVLELNFRNKGEYVRESDLLCTIVPADAPLYMNITVANKDAGFIETGLAIKYKFDAFPYTDYGTLSGKVVSISPSAVEDKMMGYVYHVKGSLDTMNYEARGKRYPVKSGMTATAEIVTEKKSIFSMLFEKLKR
jgi:multidrug efflux pump subunit AcrA (membrane-fusion protein)